jgi:Xaa-Pro aminopeptidase
MESRLGEFNFETEAQAGGAQWSLNFKRHLAHCVGMTCHDGCLHKLEPLRPGMVFSVDPQYKVESERIYLRIEDVGVVTEDGFDVFTKDVPYDVDAIEALMQQDGVLQLFPPLAELSR